MPQAKRLAIFKVLAPPVSRENPADFCWQQIGWQQIGKKKSEAIAADGSGVGFSLPDRFNGCQSLVSDFTGDRGLRRFE